VGQKTAEEPKGHAIGQATGVPPDEPMIIFVMPSLQLQTSLESPAIKAPMGHHLKMSPVEDAQRIFGPLASQNECREGAYVTHIGDANHHPAPGLTIRAKQAR
jgi:hypothetical protein